MLFQIKNDNLMNYVLFILSRQLQIIFYIYLIYIVIYISYNLYTHYFVYSLKYVAKKIYKYFVISIYMQLFDFTL